MSTEIKKGDLIIIKKTMRVEEGDYDCDITPSWLVEAGTIALVTSTFRPGTHNDERYWIIALVDGIVGHFYVYDKNIPIEVLRHFDVPSHNHPCQPAPCA